MWWMFDVITKNVNLQMRLRDPPEYIDYLESEDENWRLPRLVNYKGSIMQKRNEIKQ